MNYPSCFLKNSPQVSLGGTPSPPLCTRQRIMSDTVSSTPKTWKSLVLLTVVPLFNLIYPALFFLSFFSLISLFPFYLRMSGCNHDDVGKECSQNEVSGVPSMTAQGIQ